MKINPFKFGHIVTDDYFYDREEALLRVKQTLAGGNNLTLYAPRRYGKSSLVNKALAELEKEGYTTVYLDMMSVYSQKKFVQNYTRAIVGKQKNSLQNTVKKIAGFISGIAPSVSFDSAGMPSLSLAWIEGRDKENTLTEVINLPEKLADSSNKWIVAFDEFQEISKLNGENFEKLLRSCIQHHQNVSYIFFGSKTHLLKDMFNNKNRAFYNAASVMSLNTIDEDKSMEYLSGRFNSREMNIAAGTAAYLIQTAGNIPYYIQYIASEIWQKKMLEECKDIKNDDVDDAVKTILELKADYYWELTNKQTAYRKKVLFALSQSATEIFSKDTMGKYDLSAASSTQKALDVLIDEGIIEQEKSNYSYSDPVYKTFINNIL